MQKRDLWWIQIQKNCPHLTRVPPVARKLLFSCNLWNRGGGYYLTFYLTTNSCTLCACSKMQAVHLILIQKHWNSRTSSIAFKWTHGAKSDFGVNKLDQLLLLFLIRSLSFFYLNLSKEFIYKQLSWLLCNFWQLWKTCNKVRYFQFKVIGWTIGIGEWQTSGGY